MPLLPKMIAKKKMQEGARFKGTDGFKQQYQTTEVEKLSGSETKVK